MKLRLALAAAGGMLAAFGAQAQTIRIGELNSYKVFPAFLEPYKKGWELALEEINKAGGVNGRKLEVISRDDNGNPGDAVRVAEELLSRENASVLMGTFASHIGLAVSNLANQRKVVFVAAEPLTDKIVWENGNRYTFRLRPSTYMQVAMLVPEAAKLKKHAGPSSIRTTNTASRPPPPSRSCSRKRSPARSSSPSRRPRWARSRPARWCRR